ncbi:MAG: phosphoglucomutase/phosphomannomutase family protein [Candidatus Humimicrobiaceae bacterium]
MSNNIKFGTDGWRSIIADDFTFENVGFVTRAIAEYLVKNTLDKRGIFIGYDNRFLSDEFAEHSADMLSSYGLKVFISSVSVPTPVTAFMVREMNLDGALMFTASHNPPKYNGIKFIPDYGGPADNSVTGKIEQELKKVIKGEKRPKPSTKGIVKHISDYSSYINKLLEVVDKDLIIQVKPKVAADTMFGAGSKILPLILNEKLNLNSIIMNNWRDPLFGQRLPDPSEENLEKLLENIKKSGLDIGVALDGDADRFGIIDGKGVYISPNNAIAIILFYLTEKGKYENGDRVVRTVATTHLIDEICREKEIEIKETPVGFKYIGKAMLEGNVLIGGEESGGLSIKEHIPEKDGLLASLLMIEIQSFLNREYNGKYLSDYLNDLYNKFGTFYNIRLDIEVPEDKKQKIMDYFNTQKGKKIGQNKVLDINPKDGVKLLLEKEKAWLLVRPSGTEPLIRCYIETVNKSFFNLLKNYVKEKINNIIGLETN